MDSIENLLDESSECADQLEMGSGIPTDFLVATPSFLTGAGANFNLAGGYFVYNKHESAEEADAAAITRDWLKIAEDLRIAMKKSISDGFRESR